MTYWHDACSILCCTSAGVAARRSTFRAPACSTRLLATTDQPEGHALREGQETHSTDSSTNTNTVDGAKADSSTEHESSSPSNVATLDAPVAAADTDGAAAAAAADSAEGRSSEVSGDGGAEGAPTMAAVGQELDEVAVGEVQSKEEEDIMAELLAQQPGGQEEEEGEDGAPKPMVSADASVLDCVVCAPESHKIESRGNS